MSQAASAFAAMAATAGAVSAPAKRRAGMCEYCKRIFIPKDPRSTGRLCSKMECRTLHNKNAARKSRQAALEREAAEAALRPAPTYGIAPLPSQFRTILQPPLAALYKVNT